MAGVAPEARARGALSGKDGQAGAPHLAAEVDAHPRRHRSDADLLRGRERSAEPPDDVHPFLRPYHPGECQSFRLVRHENIPTCPASDWSAMRIYPHVLHMIGTFHLSCNYMSLYTTLKPRARSRRRIPSPFVRRARQSTRRRGIRKYSGGELNSPVEEWLNKGLMAESSPSLEGERLRIRTPCCKGKREVANDSRERCLVTRATFAQFRPTVRRV
eukprot:278121-Pyramimonas_sp.AAC.1